MPKDLMDDLIKLLPPPKKPIDLDERMLTMNQEALGIVYPEDDFMLTMNEEALGIRFPSDFVKFGRVYGSGVISSKYSWKVCSPFSPLFCQLCMRCARTLLCHRGMPKIKSSGYAEFPVFPENEGLLPFAYSDELDWVCWLTKGEPNDWIVVDITRFEKGNYLALDMGFSEYFVKVLSREIVLDRHEGGQTWDPTKDLSFEPELQS